MSASSSRHNPWPIPTPPPHHHLQDSISLKRKRVSAEDRGQLRPRQQNHVIANQSGIAEAEQQCQDVDNSVDSCYPTPDTVFFQDESSVFVWNSRLPEFTGGTARVSIELNRADTGETIFSVLNIPNPPNQAGTLPFTANDSIFGQDGLNFRGQNISYPMRFTIFSSLVPLQNAIPQPIFTVIQTTYLDSVLSAMSTSSAAAASSSSVAAASLSSASILSVASASAAAIAAASLSSQTLASLASMSSANIGSSGLQNSGNSDSFPHWAIAVIVILGVLAAVAFVALLFLIMRALRRRRARSPLRRGSIGSESPMIANNNRAAGVASPLLETGNVPQGGPGGGMVHVGPVASIVSHDGASTNSDGLFSGADAAVMAEAFRQALRKPDFADLPVVEGESPEAQQPDTEQPQDFLLSQQLAEEGTGIRSVDSSRGVRVENLKDDGGDST